MHFNNKTIAWSLIICFSLSACVNFRSLGNKTPPPEQTKTTAEPPRETIWDLFTAKDDNTLGNVNKYLWHASLDVLNFLPIKSADPFSGIIIFDKGRAPGSRQSYRATVYITDPALDARSLRISLTNANGTVSAEIKRQIENAILTRARQLRISNAAL